MLRFGKHPPKSDYRTLRLRTYLTPALGDPPSAVDVLERVLSTLGEDDPSALFPLDGNGTYGDCTIAAVAHAITVYSGMLGRRVVPDEKEVLKVYFSLTHGVDSGLPELDVLNYWQSNSVGGDKIAAFVTMSPRNRRHVMQAIDLFGGVYLGFQVQQNCLDDFHARRPWTPGPLLNEGHAVYAVAYDEDGVTVLTWGATQRATWAWWDACVDEAYAILAPEALEPGFHPGFNGQQLRADLGAVAGEAEPISGARGRHASVGSYVARSRPRYSNGPEPVGLRDQLSTA